ncbi:hypothetical protein B0H13DRAFT_2344505 [Mycena leptocephala]|nr:hypothetical protein B0H13DRAFT_2344505 [Mycena leptocephala]
MGRRSKNKENQDPGSDKKRCCWNAECDVVLTGQLAAEKSAGNQTDNAGWHQSSWTACSKALKGMEKKRGWCKNGGRVSDALGLSLEAQYQLVKMLRDKSGWGWNDQDKHIVVEDAVWEAYVAINPKLIDGAVATGEGAFHPGQQVASAPSPDWPADLPDDDGDANIDSYLKGPAGRIDPTPKTPGSPVSGSRSDDNSDMEEIIVPARLLFVTCFPASSYLSRVLLYHADVSARCLTARSPRSAAARKATEQWTRADGSPTSPQRKTKAIKFIMKIPELSKEEKTQILRLLRSDTGIADTFLAIEDEDVEYRIDYLRAELEQ